MKKKFHSEKPRVTEIIRAVGLGKDFTGVDTFYRDRGTACHKAIELYLKNQLDESSIDECYRGHFEGFMKFWKENKLGIFKAEVHLENENYQGTLDFITDDAIWDWKCSKAHDRVAEIQGAGYKTLAKVDVPFRVVQLPGDSSYEVIEYASPPYLWDATWTLYQWKKGK